MTGVVRMQFAVPGVTYDLKLERNITVIKDEGATGKSALCSWLDRWNNVQGTKEAKGLSYFATGNMQPRLLTRANLRDRVYELWTQPGIIFVDEAWHVAETREFLTYVGQSSHYFVILSRDLRSLRGITVSVNSIMALTGDRYKTLVPWLSTPAGKQAQDLGFCQAVNNYFR